MDQFSGVLHLVMTLRSPNRRTTVLAIPNLFFCRGCRISTEKSMPKEKNKHSLVWLPARDVSLRRRIGDS